MMESKRLTLNNINSYKFNDEIYINSFFAMYDLLQKLGPYEDLEDKYHIKNVQDLENKLKTLEIIKRLIINNDFELINSYEDGDPFCILRLGTQHKKWVFALVLTKEEYDLLKEELL